LTLVTEPSDSSSGTDRTNVNVSSRRSFANSLIIGFTNIDSLSNKVAELEAFLANENPDIFGICEVFPKFAHEKLSVNDIKFSGYDVFCPNTDGSRGVMLLVKKYLKLQEKWH